MNQDPSSTPLRLAVDVGGTTIKGALFRDDGHIIERRTTPTRAAERDALAGLRSVIRDLIDVASASGSPVSGVGIATPGAVDASRGVVEKAVNLGWTDLPLRQEVETAFGLPARIEHDARAGALAERHAHPEEAARYEDFVFVPIGTGVSAAITAGGVLIHGATGSAGEFGHLSISPSGDACACGQRGCVEAYVSATNVLTRYRARGGTKASSTPDLVGSVDTDNDARAVWDDLIEALASGLNSLTAVLDPSTIVIGGGLSQAGEALMTPLRMAMDSRFSWRRPPRLVRSRLGSHASLIGAAIIAGPGEVRDGFSASAMLSGHTAQRSDRGVGAR